MSRRLTLEQLRAGCWLEHGIAEEVFPSQYRLIAERRRVAGWLLVDRDEVAA